MPKDFLMGLEARNKIKVGIDKVADIVKTTLGPKGRNIVIDKQYGSPIITNDGVTIAKSIELKDPFENLGAKLIKQVADKTNDIAGDGPQDLNSGILTPDGWVRMRDIKVGMTICGTNGSVQKVIGVFPKGKKEIVKVYFSGESVVRCCEDHLWTVTTNYGKRKTLPLKEIMKDYVRESKDGSHNHRYFVEQHFSSFNDNSILLPIDPYTLGVLLGDGSLSGNNSSIEISIGKNKEHILKKIVFPEGIYFESKWYDNKNYFRIKIKGETKNKESIKDILNNIGLLGTTSRTKFIPSIYMFSSKESREALLQGLVDTDGYINNRGLFEFSSVNEKLSKSLSDICKSLGKQLTIREKSRIGGGGYSESPVFLVTERKGYKYGNKIIKIEKTGIIEDMQCIKVSNEDNLYITDGFIATHNTSTSTVITQAIVSEGLKFVEIGISPIGVRKGLEMAKNDVISVLKKNSKAISSKQEIIQIATISAESLEMGEMIADVMEEIGSDGIVTVEESQTFGLSKEIVSGMSFDRGYISPYMVTDPESQIAELKDVSILITDIKISAISELLPTLESIAQMGKKDIVIIAEDVEGEALAMLVVNKMRGVLNVLAVKAPEFGNNKTNSLEDIAIMTGGEVISSAKGMNLNNIDLNTLGTASKVIATKDKTTIIGGNGNKDAIKVRLDSIKNEIKECESGFDKEKLSKRIAKLSGGVAVIKVGANTETEITYLKHKMEDALSATKAAIEEGIVAGGGTAFAKAIKSVEKTMEKKQKNMDHDELSGYRILLKALEYPLRQIVENSGESEASVVFNKVYENKNVNFGYNARTNKFEKDMTVAGIIDPLKVTRSALENAVSVASLILTTEAAITEIINEKE